VALSTCEAEVTAEVHASKEAVWLSGFLKELKITVQKPIRIYTDNQSAISISRNPVLHARTKHMGIQMHYVRELIEQEQIEFSFVPTNLQLADALTKALPPSKMNAFKEAFGLKELE
jgi:hypothetical protein